MIRIKTLDPRNLSYDQALDVCDVALIAFEFSPIFLYWRGDTWYSKSFLQLRTSIQDPRDRLRAALYNTNKQVLLRHLRASMMMVKSTMPGTIWYVAYEQMEDGTEHVVGMSNWVLPKHMHAQSEAECGRTGLIWYVRSYLRAAYYTLYEKFLLGRLEHPLVNSRMERFWDTVNAAFYSDSTPECELAQLPEDKISSLYYPKESMVTLSVLAVLPNQQRKGVGAKLIQYALDHIPNFPTPFTHEGNTSYGPQKMYLEATDEGIGLYERFGFDQHVRYLYTDKSRDCEFYSTHMIKTREVDPIN